MVKPRITQITRIVRSTAARSRKSVSVLSIVKTPRHPQTAGFTLVELIVVMALLAIAAALAAPSLARSLRQRNLDQEATRFVALTEYARAEAVSQGIPMTVWIDPNAQRYGVEPKEGFEGDQLRVREFALHPDVSLQLDKVALIGGVATAVEFAPDGSPGEASVETVNLVDRFDSAVTIAQTKDRWSYELVKEAP